MRLKEQDFERIVTLRYVFNKSIEEIAKEVGCGSSTVGYVTQTFKVVKEQDFDKLKHLLQTSSGREVYTRWAANRLGIELPDSVWEKKPKEKVKEKPKEEPKQEPVAKPTEAKNEVIYFTRILEELQTQNELMRQLLDATIPHYIADLKDNLNTNTDVVCERLKNMEQALDGIKCNTRKRGL